jgi:hypothetical protein
MLTPDKLWKAIFEDLFPEAIAFYFTEFFHQIDWSRGFEVLDKEQKQLFPESEETHRRVDLLVKVWLIDGTEQWILIHVEVQGYRDEDFPRRMYVYYYRLTDRFKVPVSALAVLTDNDLNWRPDRYEVVCMKTRLVYEYPVFKLADYTEKELNDSGNPWSWVMKTALIGLKANWDDDSLLKIKIRLYREFREKGYPIEKTRLFLQFLKYYVRFEKTEYFDKFDHQIQTVDNKKDSPMGILELVKEHLIEEAQQKGIEKGIEQGMTKGQLAKASRITQRVIEEFPDWSDEKVADLVEMQVSFVKKIRQKMQKDKN